LAGDPHVQTRSEDGGLGYFVSISAAMEEAERDHSIWKISWMDITSGDRVRLVRNQKIGAWVYEPMPSFAEILPKQTDFSSKMEVRRLGDVK
jgi:hypothetical protein